MDLPALQHEFVRYVQTLITMGSLDRDDFRLVYQLHNTGNTGYPIVTMQSFADTVENILNVITFYLCQPIVDFLKVMECADHIYMSTIWVGAKRIKELCLDLRVGAFVMDLGRCLLEAQRLTEEFTALFHHLNYILTLQQLIERCGGSIPLNW